MLIAGPLTVALGVLLWFSTGRYAGTGTPT
jgi:hypothetical protein